MTKTKFIIRELLDCNDIEHYQSMTVLDRVHMLMDRFSCSVGVARHVSNLLSVLSVDSLRIYYEDDVIIVE